MTKYSQTSLKGLVDHNISPILKVWPHEPLPHGGWLWAYCGVQCLDTKRPRTTASSSEVTPMKVRSRVLWPKRWVGPTVPGEQVCDPPWRGGGEEELGLFSVSEYKKDMCVSIHIPSSHPGISNLVMLHISRKRMYRQTQHMDTIEYLGHNNAYRSQINIPS